MSNEINIEELERLAKAAAPGPWRRQDFRSSGEKNGIDDSDGDVVCASYGRLRPKSFDFIAAANPSAVLSLIDRLKKAEAELERERMRLTACGVVALADTPESAAKAREMRNEYRSASCDDVARRVDECMMLRAERDALAAKLAELEGQDPVAWMTANREMTSFVNFHDDDLPLYARQVPAERPVNARLLEALSALLDDIEALIGESTGVYGLHLTGDASQWSELEEGGRFERLSSMSRAREAIAAAEAAHTEPVNVDFGKRGENMFFKIDNQSFLLEYKPEEQDEFDFMKAMLLSAFSRITHGVKTEIQPVNTRLLTALKACRNKLAHDASMVAMADVAIMAAEAAPRVARLTEEEIKAATKANALNGLVLRICRAIETAVLRKNGIEVAE